MSEEKKEKIITVYVNLPEEGSPTIRRTDAIDLGDGKFKLLPADNYDPEDELWEFLPGSIVKCETRDHQGQDYLLAIEEVKL